MFNFARYDLHNIFKNNKPNQPDKMKSATKFTNPLNARLTALASRGEKYIKKGIQYDPHDLPKNAILRFCLFDQMKYPLISVHRIDSILFEFPIPSEWVPLNMLREVLIQAFSVESFNSYAHSSLRNCPHQIPDKIVFIITVLKSSKDSTLHANLIVYNKIAKRIEIFDPLGYDVAEFTEQKDLQNSIICDAIKDIKLFPETTARGIQHYDTVVDRKREGSGFCAIWTCLIAKLCVEFPSKSMRQIVEDVTTNYQHNSANICRGFLAEMRDLAFDSMRKKHGKFSKLFLELREIPFTGKTKSEYRTSEKIAMDYLRNIGNSGE